MTTVAILQSSYLPWKGYFDIMHDVDLFVFYDDVQFTRRDWRSRNKVKGQHGAQWLTVPVGGDVDRLICDVAMPADTAWAKLHLRTLQHCYSPAPHWAWVRPLLEDIYTARAWATLSELNQHVITTIARDFLGITTRLADARSFAAKGARTDRLLDILGKAGATRYVSGPAAKDYLEEGRFADAGIELVYKDYAGYPEYPQRYPPFDHFVTVIDLLCNVGPEAPRYIWGWRG